MPAVLTTMATAVHTADFEHRMISRHTSQYRTDCLPWDSAILLSEPTHCSLLFLSTAAYTGSVLKVFAHVESVFVNFEILKSLFFPFCNNENDVQFV